MTNIYPTIRTMTDYEQVKYGLCTQGLILEQDERTYRLCAGTTDTLKVYQQGAVLYVLTLNLRLRYVALDYYMGSEQEPIDGIFLQGDYAIKEMVGADWHSLPLSTLSTRLIQLFS